MKKKDTSSKSLTDWARVDALKDEEIDLSDVPEVTPEMFARAVVRRGLRPDSAKTRVTLRMDRDVVEWFKMRGHNYQAHINALLRAYMDAHRT
jgi:uncharacterized protein (DUF4415 family)